MRLIGLAGSIGVGKDSIADYLVTERGFLKFSFSDALYREVTAAFGIDETTLKDRDTKEIPLRSLAFENCNDPNFLSAMEEVGIPGDSDTPRSAREITQWWGTEYRRRQDPDYWVKQAEETVEAFMASLALYDKNGEIKGYKDAPGLVNTSVRFANERALFEKWGGEIWHVYRPGHYTGKREAYVSELTLPIETGDNILINNSDLDRLGTAVELMLRGNTVVASQNGNDRAWVPVFVPRSGQAVHDAREFAWYNSGEAPLLGDIK